MAARPEAQRGWARPLWMLLGLLSLLCAFIGALLPLMPTTVFLIMAAACFGRASPRCEAWLLRHPRFGPLLRDWREQGAMSVRSKVMACLGIGLGLGLFCWRADAGPELKLLVAALMAACALYLLSRPLPSPSPVRAIQRLTLTQPKEPRGVLSWAWLISLGLHLLLWGGLLGASLAKPAPTPAPELPVLMQLQWLPAAAPPQVLEERLAPEQRAQSQPRRALPRDPQQPPVEAAKPVVVTQPSLLSAPETSSTMQASVADSVPSQAPAPALQESSQAAAPRAPSLPPAPQAGGRASESWQARVLARLERFRSYPPGARARREQGVVVLQLRVNREGQVLSARVQQGSGHAELDRAALATVQRAQPLPGIPPDLPQELDLLVPVEFFIS
ncbi:TonB family protein [Paucibacter sp. KBW04]|uniref:TonB family protein n=1 Tax=Paucibacter sp. KBW04 TaxID=2153361 RepID=UPI000F571CF7|nr:TonB family protein [Paucibacter sp. KBW04]